METLKDAPPTGKSQGRQIALERLEQWEMESAGSLWLDAWRRLRRNRAAVGGMVFLVGLILAAIAAPILTPYSPKDPDFAIALEPPSPEHPLGTDELGRDLIARLLYGARVSLAVGLVVQLVALTTGTLVGLMAGYYGGLADVILMRLVDIMYAFPNFLFAVFMVSFLKPTVGSIILVLCVVGWPFSARLVRGQVLSLREWEFVEAARMTGASDWRIMLRHILPNTLSPLIIQFTLGIAAVIMAEAGLSFLGIGIRPPNPTWGGMIAKGRQYFRTYPHLALYPSIVLGLTVLAFNFLGDGLRDALDPRLRK
jgi:ABC-type dipeptide/oligopeptide/nickel transport system permease subunit